MSDLVNFVRSSVLKAKTLDEALAFGILYGNLQWFNPSQIVSDEEFEKHIFDRFLSKDHKHATDNKVLKNDWLHVVSSTYPVGGHTRLIRFIMNAQTELGESFSVIATRKFDPALRQNFMKKGISAQTLTGSLSKRLKDLVAAGDSAGCVVLHIHPDDLVAALAARVLRARGCSVLFVNHTDHVFSFGSGAANCVLEVSGFGWNMTRARRNWQEQSFLGIPVETEVVENSGKITSLLSVGSERKYKPSADFNFPQFLSRILMQTNIKADLVGVDGTAEWWRDIRENFGERVKFHGLLPFEDMRKLLRETSIYLDSFPMPGGSVFSEAFALGKPAFGPKNAVAGYGLVDGVRAPDLRELEKEILDFIKSGNIPAWRKNLADKVRKDFSSLSVACRLRDAKSGNFHDLPEEMAMQHPNLDAFIKETGISLTLPEKRGVPFQSRFAIFTTLLTARLSGAVQIKNADLVKSLEWTRPVMKKVS